MNQDQKTLQNQALERNLNLTYEERIEAHENARKLVEDLQQAGEKARAGSQKAS